MSKLSSTLEPPARAASDPDVLVEITAEAGVSLGFRVLARGTRHTLHADEARQVISQGLGFAVTPHRYVALSDVFCKDRMLARGEVLETFEDIAPNFVENGLLAKIGPQGIPDPLPADPTGEKSPHGPMVRVEALRAVGIACMGQVRAAVGEVVRTREEQACALAAVGSARILDALTPVGTEFLAKLERNPVFHRPSYAKIAARHAVDATAGPDRKSGPPIAVKVRVPIEFGGKDRFPGQTLSMPEAVAAAYELGNKVSIVGAPTARMERFRGRLREYRKAPGGENPIY